MTNDEWSLCIYAKFVIRHSSFVIRHSSFVILSAVFRILDFSRLLPAPLGTQMLRQMGYEVLKIERPQSLDPLRAEFPLIDMPDGSQISLLYHWLNGGKTPLLLDYADEGERERLLNDILPTCDVLIEQFRPQAMRRWRLDYETLRERFPRLIYVSLTGYGQDTEGWANEAGHDINFLALSGLLGLMRDEQGKPVMPNFQIADIAGGAYPLVNAVLHALLQRERTGKGVYIDLSMSKNIAPLMAIALSQQVAGLDAQGLRLLSGGLVNYNLYPTADGKWLALAALEMKFWRNFCQAAERADWLRAHPLELSCAAFDKSQIEAFFLTRTQAEWTKWALGKDICLTPVVELADWLAASPFAASFGLDKENVPNWV